MQPFDKHQANTADLEGCGATLVAEAATSLQNGKLTREAYRPAIDNVSGVCAPEIQVADAPVQKSATAAQGSLAWAAVVTRFWGSRVSTFNTKVDEITAALADLGPHYGAEGTGGDPPKHDDIVSAKAAATAEARRKWWEAHTTYIQDGGEKAASMLQQGPTSANMQVARDAGALPPMEIDAWETFVKGLQGKYTPITDQGIPGLAGWSYGAASTPAGWLSTWQQYTRSRFAPRGPNGQFIRIDSFNNSSWWSRTAGYVDDKNFVPRPGQATNVARWATFSKVATRAGWVAGAATGAWDQWSRDSGRTDLDTTDKVVRAGTRGALTAAGGAAGAWAGAQGGAMIGAAVGGPVGAAVGGVVGGIVGGVIGSGVGSVVADYAMDTVTEATDAVQEGLSDVGDAIGDGVEKLKFW